jgi:hypothetical protein
MLAKVDGLCAERDRQVKTIAAAPSQKGSTAGWQPTFGSGKKK